ncbi:MAG: hypothetical protein OK457_00675 [Thaumarchaeota archaeon]|nr:hypothetical protein [Nitrososphaerota archaeon]
MKIPFTVTHDAPGVFGLFLVNGFDAPTPQILVNTANLKRRLPNTWKREAIAIWAHEATHMLHYIARGCRPYSNLVSLYGEEIRCHAVQRFAERILGLKPLWPSAESGAMASIRTMLHGYFKPLRTK